VIRWEKKPRQRAARKQMFGYVRLSLFAIPLCLTGAVPGQAGCRGKDFNFCSRTFHASVACDGKDQLASIGQNHCPRGPKNCKNCDSGQDCPLIEPWEATEITIIGVEITVFEGSAALNYAYAGNQYHPNQMVFVGAGQSHTRQFFPAGTGFKLPPSGTRGHINLHISCRPEARVQAFYTVYYTVPGQPPKQPKRR